MAVWDSGIDKADWNLFLIAATFLVLLLSLGTVVFARPRSQLFAPFMPSLVVSIVIYITLLTHGPRGHGASHFHTAFALCSLLALGFALLLIVNQPERNKLGTFSWAMLGVVFPYTAFLAYLAAACWGNQCWG
jgi:hypothetical protein